MWYYIRKRKIQVIFRFFEPIGKLYMIKRSARRKREMRKGCNRLKKQQTYPHG